MKSCVFRGTRRTPTGLKKYNPVKSVRPVRPHLAGAEVSESTVSNTNSVSFFVLTEFQGENSMSSSQPIIFVCQSELTEFFRRTHQLCCRTHWVHSADTVLSKQYSARFPKYYMVSISGVLRWLSGFSCNCQGEHTFKLLTSLCSVFGSFKGHVKNLADALPPDIMASSLPERGNLAAIFWVNNVYCLFLVVWLAHVLAAKTKLGLLKHCLHERQTSSCPKALNEEFRGSSRAVILAILPM